ncbi:MAG: TatD family hydrolase, partial [Candidatus Cloacimonas acidaminovorans]
IIVHDRDAHQECYNILKKNKVKEAVFHCFTGDIIFAQQVLDEGWMISFTANITYANSKLDNVIRLVPLDRFMVETDCPYLPPYLHRGKRNSPLFLPLVVEKIAEVKEISPNEVAELSFANAYRFFRVPPDPVKTSHKKAGHKKA